MYGVSPHLLYLCGMARPEAARLLQINQCVHIPQLWPHYTGQANCSGLQGLSQRANRKFPATDLFRHVRQNFSLQQKWKTDHICSAHEQSLLAWAKAPKLKVQQLSRHKRHLASQEKNNLRP